MHQACRLGAASRGGRVKCLLLRRNEFVGDPSSSCFVVPRLSYRRYHVVVYLRLRDLSSDSVQWSDSLSLNFRCLTIL